MRLLARLLTLATIVVAMGLLRGDTFAQETGSCDDIKAKLQAAIDNCTEINEGWACYGNEETRAAPPEVRFYKPGDRRPLEELTSIETISPEGAGLVYFWTIGEADPVTVILYGGADLGADGHGFVLSMGSDGEICENSPPGMIAFTESRQPGILTVNGVKIELASTAFLTMPDPDSMIIANIEGSVVATASGPPQEIDEDWQLRAAGIGTDEPTLAKQPEKSLYTTSAVVNFLTGALGQVYDPNTDPNPPVPACGGKIRIGESILDEIHTPGQECLYTFCPDPESTVTINVDAVDQSLDPYIDLRAANLGLVAANNDRGRNDKNSLICNQAVSPSDCDQTIVVRANRNQTAGPFRLTLEGNTDCTKPPCFCRVTAARGLYLRTGPGTQYPAVRRALPPGYYVEPLLCTEDKQWYFVSVPELGVTGWIRAHPDFVECEPCIQCNLPTPGISVSVSPDPPGPVKPGTEVTFNVTIRNSGESPLILKSLSNTVSGSDPRRPPTDDSCPSLINQSLASGETKTCQVSAIAGVVDSLTDLAVATAEDPYGSTVGNEGPGSVPISCEAPKIELTVDPALYTIQDWCGLAEFKLNVTNKSAEAVRLTSFQLDPSQPGPDSEGNQQCQLQQTLDVGETFDACPFYVSDCGEEGEVKVWNVIVTAKTVSCDEPTSAEAKAPVRFDPKPTPPCPKCGPFGGP